LYLKGFKNFIIGLGASLQGAHPQKVHRRNFCGTFQGIIFPETLLGKDPLFFLTKNITSGELKVAP